MATIFIKSQIQGAKIPIGEIDYYRKVAVFIINKPRFFLKANAFGIDADVFSRKSIEFCTHFCFKFWDNRKIILTRQEFMQNCWLYPSKNDIDYVANKSVFKPKLVIGLDRAEEIVKKRKPQTDEEYQRKVVTENCL